MATDLKNMSDDEFMEAWTEAAEELDAAKARVKEFASEQGRRDIQARLDAMPDEEKAMLAQFARAEGIESKEAVNNG